MKDYLLLIRGGDARMAELSESETQEHMQKWTTYMGGLAEKGNMAGGLPLNRDGRIVTSEGVSEGMTLSDKGDYIGGYLMFKAENYDHAVELAKGCPVFELGGSIEIREALPM